MAEKLTQRQRVLRRKAAMWTERSSWFDHWKEISQFQQPRLGRYFIGDTNRGQKRHQAIVDNAALFASRTLAAGMMSGMTSPARPWFKLGLADTDLAKKPTVKLWLFKVGEIMRAVFNQSNTNRALHMMYEELGLFGTAASVMVPDFHNVVHHYPLTIGEYALGIDYTGRPNALAREYQMTVGQLVGQFGVKNCSASVVNAYDRNNLDTAVPVVHLIEERVGRDAMKMDAKNMRFSSTYIEAGASDDKVLSESGFKSLRVLAPRWAVTGNDTYGSSPGMEALGDVKQLQHQQQRKSQGIDYQVNPPLQVPKGYKGAPNARLPGGVMFVDATGAQAAIRTAFDVQINLQHLLLDIQDVRERIKATYYADLFMMLANDTRSGITATEVAERHEEKLMMLGPVLERLENELLQPLIDITFGMCADAGILPPAPPEVEGMELAVRFISVLAQAQRVVSGQGTDRLLGTVTNLAAVRPEVLDKIDFDLVVDDYSDMYGVNPEIVLPTAVASQIRAERAKAQQAAQMAATVGPAMTSAAGAMKSAGDTNTENLRDVMNMFQGYGSPSAQEV